ncbi:MAG TPA: TetR/AcrR family transcriptional regulator [Usitatibacter sp.]|nr:TetR/AcrR family transcriptional regulator [Usitatibacter sp.]
MASRPARRNVALDATSADTKTRILDAAEALFTEHGFEATSLRQLTAAAGVNLAAVNYHFGSKEELFQAVLTRRLDPMNQERIELLEALERQADGRPPSCEKVLFAMLMPALRLARDERRGGKNFLRVIGRAYADPAPFIRHFLHAQYAEMVERYKEAFLRALPHLTRQELTWRLHFVLGALSYSLASTDALKQFAQVTHADNDELMLQRLAPFLVAGLKAPALVDTGRLELAPGE